MARTLRASLIDIASTRASAHRARVDSDWLAEILDEGSPVVALAARDVGMTARAAQDAIEGMSWPRLVAAVAKAAR